MIENPKPSDWKELQSGVCRILNEVGIAAETEKTIETPRGKVEIDMYGIDENSVEKINILSNVKIGLAQYHKQSCIHLQPGNTTGKQ